MFKLMVTIGVAAIFIFPLVTAAQNIPTTPFSIVINPTYPAPNSTASLSITSGSVDVVAGIFDVFVNGKHIATGTGAQSVSFKTGRAGQILQVTVVVTVDRVAHKETIIVDPEDVTLVVEPLTTAPPFYQGAPTIPSSGSVRLVAVPDFRTRSGQAIKAATLSYSWKVGVQTLLSQSGVGKTSAIIPAPLPYRDSVVTVQVQNQSGSFSASRSVTLTPTAPVVLIYKKDPLMGIEYGHALSGNQSISGVETSFVAVPYGFSISDGGPSIAWTLDGSSAQTGDSITLRPQGRGAGSSSLSVSVDNPTTYESAAASIEVLFGSSTDNSFGLFGL